MWVCVWGWLGGGKGNVYAQESVGVCVCVPSSCTGPEGQPCVDWVSSTHSSLVESERNPHRWLSTFKKSRLPETCQLRFKFLLLISVTLQYSSIICLFYPNKKKCDNKGARRHLKMCFLMSAQSTEQEPALVIHHHKLLVLTWHVFSATDDGLVCSANAEDGHRFHWRRNAEQSGETARGKKKEKKKKEKEIN